jgi:hypothetical protein
LEALASAEMMVRRTFVVPRLKKSSRLAAARVTSMIRPRTNGPRSLMRTTTHRPFVTFSTFTLVPNGNERCAAVSAVGSQFSPDAVRLVSAYQEAWPNSADAGCAKAKAQRATTAAARGMRAIDVRFSPLPAL